MKALCKWRMLNQRWNAGLFSSSFALGPFGDLNVSPMLSFFGLVRGPPCRHSYPWEGSKLELELECPECKSWPCVPPGPPVGTPPQPSSPHCAPGPPRPVSLHAALSACHTPAPGCARTRACANSLLPLTLLSWEVLPDSKAVQSSWCTRRSSQKMSGFSPISHCECHGDGGHARLT